MIFPTIETFVRNAPLARLQRLPGNTSNTILAKLEGNNPAGSVKDLPALSMITRAEARGDIKPGDRLIEATSGNTGIALAMVAAIKGYKMTLIMPDNMSDERKASMKAYGADIILTPAAGSMEAAIDLARDMEAVGKGFILDQFSNPDNPLAHYESTGPEIWQDTYGKVTHFVSAMGTTGTIMGTSRFLKEQNPAIQIVGVQPEGDSKIPGIRRWPKAYLPKIYQADRVDRIIDIDQDSAENTMRKLASEEGIFAGVSSGGAVAAALKISVRSFRAGYLCFNPYLVRALDSVGYSYNSTNAANDLLTNFPFVNHKYKHSYSPLGNVWELPMTLSDVFHDDPITASNYMQKEAIWLDVVTRNTQNYAPTVLLIHPTRYYKLFAEQQLVNQLPPKVALVNFETFADYWVARNNVSFTTSLLNDTLTIIVPNSLLPLNDQISFVVDDGQSLLLIKVQDDLGNSIASIQSNWDNNGILVHFGYANTGINENNGAGENDITASCFPNPFSNTTTVEVWQKENCNLNVTLYNIYGQVVKTLVNEKRTPGIYRDQLDASDISGGIYFCKIISGNKSVVKKLLIINK